MGQKIKSAWQWLRRKPQTTAGKIWSWVWPILVAFGIAWLITGAMPWDFAKGYLSSEPPESHFSWDDPGEIASPQTDEGPTLLMFGASWCRACRTTQVATFDESFRQHLDETGVRAVYLDVDQKQMTYFGQAVSTGALQRSLIGDGRIPSFVVVDARGQKVSDDVSIGVTSRRKLERMIESSMIPAQESS